MTTAVSERVRDECADWFPELDRRQIELTASALIKRPRCLFYRLTLSDGRLSRAVAVKVRHDDPMLRRTDPWAAERPVLTPTRSIPPAEEGWREFEALQAIAARFEGVDAERFGVLRPRAWLPEHAATVLDWVWEPTLRVVLGRQSRWRLSGGPDQTAWVNAGAWLRRFHDASSCTLPATLAERMAYRPEVLTNLDRYAEFLARVGEQDPSVRALSQAASGRLAADLPERLDLAVGHGDFTAQNVFTAPTGRVTVFDPMPLWRVPTFEDVGRFTSGLRLLPEQALSQGLVLPRERLDRCEHSFLRGYFGPGVVPEGTVHGFQALLLLDRWAALITKQTRSAGVRRKVRDLRVRAAARYFRGEARRLIALLDVG